MRGVLLNDKRGVDLVFPPLMFVILNIMFFGILLAFVINASTGAGVYEQAYAKQVALLIDEAKPEMQILVDFKEGFEIAKENEKTSNLVRIDDETNEVIVSLGDTKGYGYKYFSDNLVNVYDDLDNNLIVINIGEKIFEVERPIDFDKEVSNEELREAVSKDKNCEDYFDLISKYSKKYDISPLLVLAVMMHESNCDSKADNGADVGLMQINLKAHCGKHGLSSNTEKCKRELKDPETNINVGCEILRWGYDTYGLVSKREAYEKRVKEICKDADYQKLYLSYTGWEIALRAYNGFGCSPVYIQYVDKVKNKLALIEEESDVKLA